MRCTWTTVAAVALTLVASSAEAGPSAASQDKEDRVAVLPIDFAGDMPDAWRDKMTDELVRGLIRAGFETVAPQDVQRESGIDTCDNDRCLNYISDAVRARYVVRARITVDDKDYEVQADVLDSEDGSLVASSTERCDLCGAAEVTDLISAQAISLRQKIQALALGPALYTFESTPAGARVYVDGKLVGITPVEVEVTPGEHRAQAQLDGFLDQTRTLTAVKGVREELQFALQVRPKDPLAQRRRRAMRISGAALLGVGVASLAAGIAFLVIDERPYESRCSGDDVDAMGNCRQRYNTLVHGAVLTGVGGVALGAGIGLWIGGRKRAGSQPSAQARLGLTPRGIAVSGRF